MTDTIERTMVGPSGILQDWKQAHEAHEAASKRAAEALAAERAEAALLLMLSERMNALAMRMAEVPAHEDAERLVKRERLRLLIEAEGEDARADFDAAAGIVMSVAAALAARRAA